MKNKIDLFAKLISGIFSPFLTITGLYFYLILKNYAGWENQLFLIIKFSLITLLPVIILLWILKKKGKIKNLDMTDRRDRYLFNIIVLILIAILLFLLKPLGLEKFFGYILTAFIGFFILSLITFFWKISGHMFAITLFMVCIFEFSVNLLIIGFPVIGLVTWSRIYLKKHDFTQTLAGALLSFAAFYLAKYLKII